MTQGSNWQQPNQYQFPPTFQNSLAKLLVRDPRFFTTVQPELPLEFFSRQEQGSEYFVRAMELIYSYADKHRRQPPPPQAVFDTFIGEHVATLPPDWQRPMYDGLRYYSWVLYQEPFVAGEIEAVREHTYSWIRKRAEMSLMVEAKNAIDQGQSIESINFANRLKRIAQIGHVGQNLGLELFHEPVSTWNTIFTQEIRRCIPIGKRQLDHKMGGGLGRKELTVVAAPPNTGKTTTMCAMAGSALVNFPVNQTPVVYISCEQSDLLIMQKIISCITNIPPSKWLEGNNPQIIWQWINYFQSSGAKLAIRQFPSGRATTAEIEAYILTLADRWGAMPGLVCVDYADLLASTRRSNEKRFELSEIYTDLRAIAVDLDIAVLTATQTNRESMGKERINLENLAECFDKAAIADIIMFFCQTEEEQRDNRGRLFFGKNRNRQKYVEVPFHVNYELARMEEDEHRIGMEQANQQAQVQMNALQRFGGQYGQA